jgi:hypothetical protein
MSKAKLRADAINRFIVDAKSQGVYDALKASCVMAGWDSLAGALTPLAGTAPSNNGFLAADYDRGTGLKGDGTKYLDSRRANNADQLNDRHYSVYLTAFNANVSQTPFGSLESSPSYTVTDIFLPGNDTARVYSVSGVSATDYAEYTSFNSLQPTFVGATRSNAAGFSARAGGVNKTTTGASVRTTTRNETVFARNHTGSVDSRSGATIAFYSIGEALDLALLDALVSRLLADFRSIDEDGMDRDALAYIRNVEAADGSYLELGVKKAIDTFVRGCKYDGIWDSIKASCILCGARTLAGALVPLAGTAPTNVADGFVSGDYTRGGATPGLKGDGTSYLDSNYAFPAGLQDDMHIAGYVLEQPAALGFVSSSYDTPTALNQVTLASSETEAQAVLARPPFSNVAFITVADANGFIGASRSDSSTVDIRADSTQEADASPSSAVTALNQYIFARNSAGTANTFFTGRVAFYSLGESLDLAFLDARVTALVTAIGAAV